MYPQRPKESLTIVQPNGRLGAQACHATQEMIFGRMKKDPKIYIHATTRIIKECRDSFELLHAYNLLVKAKIPTYFFLDSQEGEYDHTVTAIATEPILKEKIVGLIDYLPLWDPERKVYG